MNGHANRCQGGFQLVRYCGNQTPFHLIQAALFRYIFHNQNNTGQMTIPVSNCCCFRLKITFFHLYEFLKNFLFFLRFFNKSVANNVLEEFIK